MKQLLPLLLCYVLMTTQAYAISGGPVFGGSSLNPVGVYSGTIMVKSESDFNNPVRDPVTGIPIIDPNTGQTKPTVSTNVNALGLFSLGVPSTNVATGAFLIFVDGIVFRGTITASVNPDRAQLNGIINGTYNYHLTVPTSTGTSTVAITAQANGQIAANIAATRTGAISSATLTGRSVVAINDGNVGGNTGGQFVTDRSLDCIVSGFRQSTTYSAVTAVGTTTQ